MAKFNMGQVMPLFLCVGAFVLIKKFMSGGGIMTQLFGTTEAEKNTQVTGDIIDNIPVNVAKTSFSVSQAKIYAEQLQKSMNPVSGFSPDLDGTDEDGIFRIFSYVKNKEDAKLLYKSFGLRQYTTNWFLDNVQIDLVSWIYKELSSSDISKIISKLNWMIYE